MKGSGLPKVMQQVCVIIRTKISVFQLLVQATNLCGFQPGDQEAVNTCLLLPDNIAFALVSGHGGTGSDLWLSVSFIIPCVGGSVSGGLTPDLVKKTIAESRSMTRDLFN